MTAIDVYYHPLFLEHETGEHPENKTRLAVTRPGRCWTAAWKSSG